MPHECLGFSVFLRQDEHIVDIALCRQTQMT